MSYLPFTAWNELLSWEYFVEVRNKLWFFFGVTTFGDNALVFIWVLIKSLPAGLGVFVSRSRKLRLLRLLCSVVD
jgi:hypothetical protein